MYICICNAVTDSDIRNAAEEGVRNMQQLRMETGCASNCGKCEPLAREILSDSLKDQRPFLAIVASPSAA